VDGVGFGVCTPPPAKLVASRQPSQSIHAHPVFPLCLNCKCSFTAVPRRTGRQAVAVAVASFVRIEESLVRRMIPILCFHSCARNFAKNKPISNKPQVVRALLVQGCSVRGSHVHPSPKELELFRIANLDPPR
jgi:hypothetical protein